MIDLREIESEIASLPPNLRAEVLDFVQFVERRHGLPDAQAAAPSTEWTDESPLYKALEAAGFVGCIESDEQLSTRYKNLLDFSSKCGTKP